MMMMVEAVCFWVEAKVQSWFWNVFKEEVVSKSTQAFWSHSVTEEAVRVMEKPEVDLRFLRWDETGKCVGGWKYNLEK